MCVYGCAPCVNMEAWLRQAATANPHEMAVCLTRTAYWLITTANRGIVAHVCHKTIHHEDCPVHANNRAWGGDYDDCLAMPQCVPTQQSGHLLFGFGQRRREVFSIGGGVVDPIVPHPLRVGIQGHAQPQLNPHNLATPADVAVGRARLNGVLGFLVLSPV